MGSEVVHANENKNILLSSERIPVLDSSRKRGICVSTPFVWRNNVPNFFFQLID